MLVRILIILALVVVAVWLLKKSMAGRDKSAGRPDRSRGDGDQARLVECAHCGARLPATDAVWKEGQTYCSMTHRNLGPKK